MITRMLMLSSLSSLARTLACGLLLVLTALPAAAGEATVITWNQPTNITYGTPISVPATATRGGAPVAGTFTYDPPLGTVLPQASGNQRIWTTFVPAAGGKSERVGKNVRVSAATLTVTSTATKVFGAPVPALTPTYSGFVNGDTAATVLSGRPALSTTATASSGVGSYPIMVSKGTLSANNNYNVAYVTGSLAITRAPATITLGGLAHTYDGNRHAATVTTTPPGLATTVTYNGNALPPVNAGSYPVTASVSDPNYAGFASGTLTIAQAVQTIAFAPLGDAMVGEADQPLVASATSGLPVAFTVDGPAVIVAGVLRVTAAGTVTVTASQAGYGNWAAAVPMVQTITAIPSNRGLLASYFANRTLSGAPVLSRQDTQVDFDWADGSPAPGVVPADRFSARWDGEIVPRFNEDYTLIFSTDDGVRVWLDHQLIVDHWHDRGVGDSTHTFPAQAGKPYRIRMEYYENAGLAVARLRWSSASETTGPIPASQLRATPPEDSGPVGTGTGLSASYFANETVAGTPALTRMDAGVDFDWGGGSPGAGIPADSFSARWSGEIQPRYSEPYTLTLRTDDGVRMWLDGQLVINDWFLRGVADSTFTFPAEAGRRYAIRIEFYEHTGQAVAQLSWYSARQASGTVPASQLYPLPTPVVDVDDPAQPVAEGEAVALSGSVSGTGTAVVTCAWTQVSGPATATITATDQANTTARFPLAGDYVMQLSVFNGHVTVSDTTTVTVLAPDVSTDLVAHYAFDEADGQLALDSSGHHHTGTLAGATRTAGKSRGALRFDGTSYVWALNNEDLDAPIQALTLSTWLKPDVALSQMAHPWPMPIYRAQYEDSTGYALMVTFTETDQFGLRLHHQAGLGQVVEANTATPLNPGAWVHAAGVYDGTTAKLYLNGVLVQSTSTGPITLRNAPYSPLYLGYGFEGAMDEVRIYHRALSRIDVYGLAQSGTDRRMPGVDAGPDQTVTLGSPTTFAGSASDDAGSGAVLAPRWKQIAGPADALLSDAHIFAPQATFTVAGTYRFQLEVSDGVLTGRDELRIEVSDGTVDLVSGLILHYRADEGSGTLVADATGNGHDALFSGNPQWSADGQLLGALMLDGSSVVESPVASDLSSPGQMTLAVWLRADRPLVDMAHPYPFVIDHSDYLNNRGFALMTVLSDSNTFGFRLHTGTGRREVTMDGLPVGTWVHVVATFDGQTMRLFRDGTLIDINATGPIPLPPLDAPLRVGDGFEGLMDDVRIYDRALSPHEVQSLHAVAPLSASG